MQLVVLADRWDPDGGGRERYTAEFAEWASTAGCQLSIRLVAGAGTFERRGLRSALAAMRAADPDVRVLASSPVPEATHYQLHGGLMARAFDAERASMRSAVGRAFFAPALRFNRRRQRLLANEARILAASTALMAFSDRVAGELKEAGVPAARIVVARPGVNLNRFHPDGAVARDERPNARALRLAFVGHNFTLKGLHTAILAVAHLQRAGVRPLLTVAGRGPAGPFARAAARAGVRDCVRFAGNLSQDALADTYRAADALVHPSFYDPFPRVIVEALACGCPVVTTERCGAAEIITSGRQGFIVHDPSDADGVATALGQLLDRSRREAMSGAAAELGRQLDAAAHFKLTLEWLRDRASPA